AQRDPLVEYQKEGYALFQQMMEQIREESVGFLFNLEVEVKQDEVEGPSVMAKGLNRSEEDTSQMSYSAPSDAGGVEVRNERGQVQKAQTAQAQRQAQQSGAGAQQQRRPHSRPVARGAFGQQVEP